MSPHRIAALSLLILSLAACGSEDSARASEDADGPGAFATARDLPPYRVIEVANPAVVSGAVEARGALPRDTMVQTMGDQRVCGERFLDRTILYDGRRIAQVVVWLEGIRAGKPLPITRRFEVTSRRCALEPRVQAVLAGGTLNVKSADPLLHRTRILQAASGRTLDLVRQNDQGQVVPVQGVLARPGRIELRCDLHPWTRAWIQVFDHPYFAVTDDGGRFRIDGVPPGTYALRAWHERLGAIEQRLLVAAGAQLVVDVAF